MKPTRKKQLVPNKPGWWWRLTNSGNFWFPVWANIRRYRGVGGWKKTVNDGQWGGELIPPIKKTKVSAK